MAFSTHGFTTCFSERVKQAYADHAFAPLSLHGNVARQLCIVAAQSKAAKRMASGISHSGQGRAVAKKSPVLSPCRLLPLVAACAVT